MTSSRFVAILGACVLLAGSAVLAGVQQRPNFSGRWTIVLPEKGAGQEQIIKHDDKTLTKTPVSQRGGPPATYQIDGVEHRSVMPMQGEQIVIVNKALWEGNKLVITTIENYPTGQRLSIREVWSQDDQGRLVIEASETAEGQPPRVMKIVMQKK
jgi:hypothetical protein